MMAFLEAVRLFLGCLSILGIIASAYELGRMLVGRIRLAHYDRRDREEAENRPPVPPMTPEERIKRHQELLDAGYIYDPCFLAYTRPVKGFERT